LKNEVIRLTGGEQRRWAVPPAGCACVVGTATRFLPLLTPLSEDSPFPDKISDPRRPTRVPLPAIRNLPMSPDSGDLGEPPKLVHDMLQVDGPHYPEVWYIYMVSLGVSTY
jgi:hypothetical protein